MRILVLNPQYLGDDDRHLSAVGVMDVVATLLDAGTFDFDAVVLAGFGEHGRDALAEMVSVPVFDIAECAAHVACLIGRRFSVVTTLARSIAPIEDRLLLAGLSGSCASVRACGLGTAEVDADPEGAVAAIVAEAARAVTEDGAEVICLGCAGMAGVTEAISAKVGVPAIDGVGAAVALAHAVVGLGLQTSKADVYASGPDNRRSHWLISRALGLDS